MHPTLDPKLTLDGVMTLVAGILAFLAVQWQLREEKKTRKRREGEENKAIALGLLCEIDAFYAHYLRNLKDLTSEKLANVRLSPMTTEFHMYGSNAHRLGFLGKEDLETVVLFYSATNAYLNILNAIRTARRDQSIGVSIEEAGERDWAYAKGLLPGLIKGAFKAASSLTVRAGVPFAHPRVALAGEPKN